MSRRVGPRGAYPVGTSLVRHLEVSFNRHKNMPYIHYNRYFSVKDLSDRLQFEVMQKYGLNARTSASNVVAQRIKNGDFTFTHGIQSLKHLEEAHRGHSS
jgi:hypothetical protein